MTTPEKVAYLRGLVEGYGMDTASREGKMMSTILDILEDLSLDVEDLSTALGKVEDGLEDVSRGLDDIEDLLYDEGDDPERDLEDEEDDVIFYDIQCPACGATISFDESVLRGGVIECPACGKRLELLPEEEDENETEK